MSDERQSSRDRFVARLAQLKDLQAQAKPALEQWVACVEALFCTFEQWLDTADVAHSRHIYVVEDPVVGRYETLQLQIPGAFLNIDIVPVSRWADGGPCVKFQCAGMILYLDRSDDAWSFRFRPFGLDESPLGDLTEDSFWGALATLVQAV